MPSTQSYSILSPKYCEALVIGGGIAGCWSALKLVEQGIATSLITYDLLDRGGPLGATGLSVGAINTSVLSRPDYQHWLQDIGRGQTHPCTASTIQNFLADELIALQEIDPLKPIQLGMALASGSGKILLKQLRELLLNKGVDIINNGWVTRFDITDGHCAGVQYQIGTSLGTINTATVILAPGGYASLFQGAVKSGTYGAIQARFLMAGGTLSNTEFIFKHGYGQPDLGKLTPTEELPGAQITDDQGQSVAWLEEELFHGRGTHNHLQAFMTWRKDENKRYFVDFTFCPLHRALISLIRNGANLEVACTELQQLAPLLDSQSIQTLINPLITQQISYDYNFFNKCKVVFAPHLHGIKLHVRQISYFSMGGIWHQNFLTNIKNVWVNGEAMHDFGADRVGGLPWALYLCAAKKIALTISENLKKGFEWRPVSLVGQLSSFHDARLKELQVKLFQHQESGHGQVALEQLNMWLCDQKQAYDGCALDDYYAYLTMAQAIVSASLCRKESRGCFFRQDYSQEDVTLAHMHSITYYDVVTQSVISRMQPFSSPQLNIQTTPPNANAIIVLLLKHLDTPTAQRTAYFFDDQIVSYQALNDKVQQVAYSIRRLGLLPGDKLAIFMHDSPDWVALFLACLQSGIVAVALNTFVKADELPIYIKDCEARALIGDNDLITDEVVQNGQQFPNCTICSFQALNLSSENRETQVALVAPTTPAFILYSSGSTGKSKAVVHQHASLAFTAENFADDFLAVSASDVLYSSSKLFFAYGLGNSLTFPLFMGASCVLKRHAPKPEQLLELLQNCEISLFFSIPAIYAQLLALPQIAKVLEEGTRLRQCISAGEPLSPTLAKRWVDMSRIKLVDGLGSTEALHIFLCNIYESEKHTLIGRVVKGYEVTLLDENNFAIDTPGITGNLAVRGGSRALSYVNNSQASAAALVGDLLLTGDQYQRSAQGHWLYIGRKGDLFKSKGLWASSFDIANHILQLPFIKEAAHVVFMHDQQQYTTAFIVWNWPALYEANVASQEISTSNTGQDLVVNWVQRPLLQTLSAYKMPQKIYAITALPRTAIGKLNRPALIRLATQALDQEKHSSTKRLHNLFTIELI